MSARSDRLPVVGFVCEGSTDFVVLRAVAEKLLGSIDARSLQPQTDALDRQQPGAAAGWSEVRAWCQRLRAWAEVFDPPVGDPLDLLVIALDLDIAVQAGVEKASDVLRSYDARLLCDAVKAWLPQGLAGRVLIVVPVMAIEAWVLAALYPRRSRPERERSPAGVLADKRKLERNKRGEPWKTVQAYRRFAEDVRRVLPRVRRACGEAERYASKLERWATDRTGG